MKKLLLFNIGLALSLLLITNKSQAQNIACVNDDESYNIHNLTTLDDAGALYFSYFTITEATMYSKAGIYVTSEMLNGQNSVDLRFLLYQGTSTSIGQMVFNVTGIADSVGYHEVSLNNLILQPGSYYLGTNGAGPNFLNVRFQAKPGAIYAYIQNAAQIFDPNFDYATLANVTHASYSAGFYFGTYLKTAYLDTLDTNTCALALTIDGTEYSSNTTIDVYSNALSSCDSIITYNLFFNGDYDTTTIRRCVPYVWPVSGETYDSTGVYDFVVGTNGNGCPIVETLDLRIEEPFQVDVDVEEYTLSTITGTDYSYQWFTCIESLDSIIGATASTYTAPETDSYAVVVDNGYCKVISDCIKVEYLSLGDVLNNTITVFPNPSSGVVTLSSAGTVELASIELIDLNGKVLQSKGATTLNIMTYSIHQEAGVYFLKLVTVDGGSSVIRLIKN